ncbi:chromosome loss- protein [Cladophialophora chaetospira]|uniref:Chromosome loss- protein n=1 Tax=Cladophialophora chaetospira TaxID=386627 RepID=A0AA38XJH0_9EURO|nr:chromosome loss- protein [Cladophialophora chaetospira]
MAPILVKSLNRLSKEAIINLAIQWLEDGHTSSPYLLCNRTGFEADDEDYQHTPAESIEELKKLYIGLRSNISQTTKRDVIDRIVDGDWRRGISLHQHAMIDFAHLEQNDSALKWSALKLVPLEADGQRRTDDADFRPAEKRKLSCSPEPTYPQITPQAFLSALKAEISPLVKAHYHLHRMPSPYNLTILRLYISPTSSFVPSRSKHPRRPKHATDPGRIVYIALPDSCPHVYISISGSSANSSSSGRSKSSARDAKEKIMAKVDMAAMKKIVLEAIPKAMSRPQQRWALESTRLVARSLRAMCELRGNGKPGTGGGAYSIFAEGEKSVEKSPVDVQMAQQAPQDDERQRLIDKRFGHVGREHYAALDRVHVKLSHPQQFNDPGESDDPSLSTEQESTGAEVFLTFSGSDVFGGLKKLAELGPSYVDLDKTPAWMTGELGLSNLTVWSWIVQVVQQLIQPTSTSTHLNNHIPIQRPPTPSTMPSKYLSKLQGKSVLLVGGSAGIGYGIAEGALEFGAKVVIASRSQDRVTAAVEKLKATYPDQAGNIRGHTISLDSANANTEEQLVQLFDFVTDKGKTPVDHIVETVGDLELRGKLTIESVTPELMAQAFSTRIVGVSLLAKVGAKYLKKEYTSSFTMTTGGMLYRPRKGASPFIAAAGGKEPFTKALALDLAPIRVNLVSPGAIDTELLWSSAPGGKAALEEAYKKVGILNRIGDVEDVVEGYLAIMKSGFTTGSTVHIEGGFLLA